MPGVKENRKMCRKIFTGLAMLGVGAYLITGTSMGSYARTAYVQTVGYFKGQIPLEFQLERAKQLVSELGPDIHRAARDIAIEEVRVARLQQEVTLAQKDQQEQETAILALREQVGKGQATYTIGSRTFTLVDLEKDLSRRFKSFRRASDHLSDKSKVLQAREAKLAAARDTYVELLDSKKELEGEIESLDSQQKILEAKKVAKRIVIDEGRFQAAREALADVKERLAVDQKLIETEGFTVEPVPAEELPPANLTQEIDAFFSQKKASHPSA
jgi:chromosome segregation ATPase